MLEQAVIGLFQGALYGMLAVGLVLIYKGARVFNFAQGEFGTIAGYATFGFWSGLRLPFPLAVLFGLVAAVLLGLVVERLIIRPLFNASRITVLVATVGTALLIIQLTFFIAKEEARILRPVIQSTDQIVILGAVIGWQQILTLLVLAALALLLWLFFARTNLGLAVLATSQDPLASRIVGISVPGVSRFIWGFAALLGGIAGILQIGTPGFALVPGIMTGTTLVPAFTGAVLGGMTSLPGAFIGGVVVGIVQHVGIFALEETGVPGASELTVLGVLLLVLLIRPRGLLGTEA
ncbi:MAG TPA: branched-chain amino acid ABC transporter permease [Actinomycetota bacterium]|nr:branched-chain amino acid ABC transporter permease [Actinomycetota bacterium]